MTCNANGSHSMPKASKAIISTKEETPYGMKRSGMECGEFHMTFFD